MAKKTVIREPDAGFTASADLVLRLATVADDINAWGFLPSERDKQLREFWPTEPLLASAIYSTASRYAAFGWTLEGPPKTVNQTQRMLHGVEQGQGWIPFIIKILIDLFTQDNGAWAEVIRTGNSESAPVISMNHLDSNRCIRTGRRNEPVIYYDNHSVGHVMKWYQVIQLVEMPSPIESMRGMQYCTVTRMLRAAQIMRDISIYKREKISGRFTRSIHLVSGVQKQSIDTAVKYAEENANNQGLIRYMQPVIVASLDPTATVSHVEIAMAALPDGFNPETELRWYINQLALAFGTDYQDFAPLPGGNLGTAQQSETLHMKARGKGSKLFMSLFEHILNFHGVLPGTVQFTFGDQDVAEDVQNTEIRLNRAKERQIRIQSGELTPQVARQIAADIGDLDPKYIDILDKSDEIAQQLAIEAAEEAQAIQEGTITEPSNVNKNKKPANAVPLSGSDNNAVNQHQIPSDNGKSKVS